MSENGVAKNQCAHEEYYICPQLDKLQAELQAELEAKTEEIKLLKGTCMCMDCGKIIKTVEQSKHNKKCKKETTP